MLAVMPEPDVETIWTADEESEPDRTVTVGDDPAADEPPCEPDD